MSIPAHVIMAPVTGSSNISRIGHDPEASHLYVDFGREDAPKVYRYNGVSPEDVAAFHEAPSKGRHFAANIKGRFDFERVSP